MIELSTPAVYGEAVKEMQKCVYAELNKVELRHVQDLLALKDDVSSDDKNRLTILANIDTCRESKVLLLEDRNVCTSAFQLFQDNLSDGTAVQGSPVNTAVLNRTIFDKAVVTTRAGILQSVAKIREQRALAHFGL